MVDVIQAAVALRGFVPNIQRDRSRAHFRAAIQDAIGKTVLAKIPGVRRVAETAIRTQRQCAVGGPAYRFRRQRLAGRGFPIEKYPLVRIHGKRRVVMGLEEPRAGGRRGRPHGKRHRRLGLCSCGIR